MKKYPHPRSEDVILSLSKVRGSQVFMDYADAFKVEKILDLENPWGSSFINKDELIITEKSGKIKLIDIRSKKISEISHNLNFLEHGQGGLLDILYKDNFIYRLTL